MNPLFKILRVDTAFALFDRKVGQLGWSRGCSWLMGNLRVDYTISSKKVPQKGPVLIYANHPTGLTHIY